MWSLQPSHARFFRGLLKMDLVPLPSCSLRLLRSLASYLIHLSDKGWCSNGTRSATAEKLKAWIPYPQGKCLSQALLCTNLSRQVLSGVIYALVAEGYFLSGMPAPRLGRRESAQRATLIGHPGLFLRSDRLLPSRLVVCY